jgi:hypothetical protein
MAPVPSDAAPVAAARPCAGCASDAALDFGTTWLCLACYHVSGSTCAGAPVARERSDAAGPGPAGVC